jgi:hypothetical protein
VIDSPWRDLLLAFRFVGPCRIAQYDGVPRFDAGAAIAESGFTPAFMDVFYGLRRSASSFA